MTKTDTWQTRPLVREGAPKRQDSNFEKKNLWSNVPDLDLTPRHSDWLTVSRNVTLTLTNRHNGNVWVILKRRFTFNGLHSLISQKRELFITTAVRTFNPRVFLNGKVTNPHWRWRLHIPPKRRLTYNGEHAVISQKTELISATVGPCLHIHNSGTIKTYELYWNVGLLSTDSIA
jgi:hypothetical protein